MGARVGWLDETAAVRLVQNCSSCSELTLKYPLAKTVFLPRIIQAANAANAANAAGALRKLRLQMSDSAPGAFVLPRHELGALKVKNERKQE